MQIALANSLNLFVRLSVIGIILLIILATFLFYAELIYCDFNKKEEKWYYNDDSTSPGKLSPYQSIPHTLYLVLGKFLCMFSLLIPTNFTSVTMGTVGYGSDGFPITPLGKAVAGVAMLLGILVHFTFC